MGGHSSHRVFVGLMGRHSGEDVNLWIVGHHALVHTVECQTLSVRTPEGTLPDAELVAVDALSIYYFATSVRRQLVFLAVTIHHIQLVVLHIGCCFRDAVPVVGCLSRYAVLPYNFVLLEIDQDKRLPVA